MDLGGGNEGNYICQHVGHIALCECVQSCVYANVNMCGPVPSLNEVEQCVVRGSIGLADWILKEQAHLFHRVRTSHWLEQGGREEEGAKKREGGEKRRASARQRAGEILKRRSTVLFFFSLSFSLSPPPPFPHFPLWEVVKGQSRAGDGK